jgi:cytochrome c oxidase subunit 1
MVAIPSAVQIFCWVATIWGGKMRLKSPMLFVLGFFGVFIIGGMTGVMLASVPLDRQLHDTFFVVAHFHYVLIGGAVFPLFGAIYYWFPKWTGRFLDERVGWWNFWLFFVGFNVTFFPLHVLGLRGMPRRVYTYLGETGWGNLNLLATGGALVMAVSLLLFLLNAWHSRRRGEFAGRDPWGGPTLEWSTTSPPPSYGFARLPTVEGRDALWCETPETPVVVGLSTEKREVLSTTIMDAQPEHRHELVDDSIWPFTLAVVATGTIVGVIFHPIALPIGLALSFSVLFAWFWRELEPKRLLVSTLREKPLETSVR